VSAVGVEVVAVFDGALTLLAASNATTWYEYDVAAARPVSVQLVVVGDATSVLLR
jgi:hypothetical protein